MSHNYLPAKDADLEDWIANFLQVAASNLSALGLGQNDLATLSAPNTQFVSGITQTTAAKLAVTTAVAGKDAARKTAVKAARVLVNKIQGNPTVTPALKASLRITNRTNHKPHTAPVIPDFTAAVPTPAGTNHLKWKPNGNTPGTQYVIQAQAPAASNWTQVDVVTASRYAHKGQTPGMKITYRILARRNSKLSDPSAPLSVYDSQH